MQEIQCLKNWDQIFLTNYGRRLILALQIGVEKIEPKFFCHHVLMDKSF